MGLFDKKAVSPEVAECDRQIAAIADRRNNIIYSVGRQFLSTTSVAQVQGTPYEAMITEYEQLAAQEAALEKRKLAAQGLRKCENCGNILVLDSMFCNMCGQKFEKYISDETLVQVQPGAPICPQCKAECVPGAVFCRSCGFRLGS